MPHEKKTYKIGREMWVIQNEKGDLVLSRLEDGDDEYDFPISDFEALELKSFIINLYHAQRPWPIPSAPRKVIQISVCCTGSIDGPGSAMPFVLCDDGTMWHINLEGKWNQVEEIPQP